MADKETNQLLDRITDGTSDRAALATGALATLGAGAVTGGAVTQEDADPEDDVLQNERFRVAAFRSAFRPGARFIITSDTVDYTPDVPTNIGGPFTGYNTHFAAYLNTAERFPVFVAEAANLDASFDPKAGYFVDERDVADEEFAEPALYEFDSRVSPFEGSNRIVTTYAFPLEQDAENLILDNNFSNREEINEFLF